MRSFVIRSGKFTKGQKNVYWALSPKYCLQYRSEAPATMSKFWNEQLSNRKKFLCEIGFGNGSATWQIAKQQPETLYLGVEVYRSGISCLMQEAEKQQLNNLRIIEHDALEVLQNMIPEQSLDGLHIFFPDPWHKKKHRKRRIVNAENLELFHRSLKSGGYCYFVTDWQDYADSVRELVAQEDWECCSEPQSWRPQSKFEAKAIREGRSIFELFLVKKSSKISNL